MKKNRCSWCLGSDIYEKYHDNEWGIPCHNDKMLFELLTLEGAQAGLSWLTVLKKREAYREAFDNFDIRKVASYKDEKIQELLKDGGIIRNRLKINSAVRNAKVFIEIQDEFGSFDNYIWGFVNGEVIENDWKDLGEVPARTELSDEISGDLKRRGMNFVGSTIIYAYMQAIGLVNDHVRNCFRKRSI